MHVPLCNDLTCNPPTRIVKRRETILVEGEKFIAQTGLRQFIIPLLLELIGDLKIFTYGSGDKFHAALYLSRKLRWKDPNRNWERQISIRE